jgi:TPR repeat protein
VVLGHLTRRGRGVPRSPERAAELYRRACDMNRAFGCLALAGMFARGEGVAADARRAEQLASRACDLDPLACPRGDGPGRPAEQSQGGP